jgi:hypothetical protein
LHRRMDRFPHCGKLISILWKKSRKVFHSVEKIPKSFPYCGKFREKFSILWKKSRKVFHTVENGPFGPHAAAPHPP